MLCGRTLLNYHLGLNTSTLGTAEHEINIMQIKVACQIKAIQ